MTETFEATFAAAPDLSDMTYAARRVLVASAALFYEQGAAGTSVRDIAKACGLSPGAFYKHFGSRDDVLYVLVKHGHDSIDARIATTVAASAPDAVSRVAAFVHAYVTAHLVHPEVAKVVRRGYVDLSPERLEIIVARRRALRTQLTSLLKAGVRSGEFDLLAGRAAATRTAVMILDMCSRTSEWYDASHARSERPELLAHRYVDAAMRLAGRSAQAARRTASPA